MYTRVNCFCLRHLMNILFDFSKLFILVTFVAKPIENINQEDKDLLIKESFNQVTKNLEKYFASDDTNVFKCKIKLQNCIFQTDWDKVVYSSASNLAFEQSLKQNGEQRTSKLNRHEANHKLIRGTNDKISNNRQGEDDEIESRLNRAHNRRRHIQRPKSQSNETVNDRIYLYYFCQAFLVSRYCLDDTSCKYSTNKPNRISSDNQQPKNRENLLTNPTKDSNFILNKNQFNKLLDEFRNSITQNECNFYQQDFSSRALLIMKNASKRNEMSFFMRKFNLELSIFIFLFLNNFVYILLS